MRRVSVMMKFFLNGNRDVRRKAKKSVAKKKKKGGRGSYGTIKKALKKKVEGNRADREKSRPL